MSETVLATVTLDLPAPCEAVFEAWLDPLQVRQWMSAALKDMGLSGDMQRVEIDPVEGGCFRFSDLRPEGEAQHWGTYRQIDYPGTLIWTWFTSPDEEVLDNSLVTLKLTATERGCQAVITHQLAHKWRDYLEQVEQGWSCLLKYSGQKHGAD